MGRKTYEDALKLGMKKGGYAKMKNFIFSRTLPPTRGRKPLGKTSPLWDTNRKPLPELTLALISYCYHYHPRGENVHEVMEQLEQVEPDSVQQVDLCL